MEQVARQSGSYSEFYRLTLIRPIVTYKLRQRVGHLHDFSSRKACVAMDTVFVQQLAL